MLRVTIAAFAAATFISAVSTAVAQDAALQMYGEGLHAYFDGEYESAFDLFTDAIELGPQDPRPYYFRGLTLIKVDRADAAEEDFNRGAELEAKSGTASSEVNKALTRIQGKIRIELQKHRRKAREKMRLQ